jgi:hypothetical protein
MRGGNNCTDDNPTPHPTWGINHPGSEIIREESRPVGNMQQPGYVWRCPHCKAEWWSVYDW